MVKKILSIVLWVITGAALITLFVFGRKSYRETPLKGIVFELERCHNNGFVEKDALLASIEAICNMEHQTMIKDIDLMKINKLVNDNPWISSASAYIGLNDTLVIKAKEYEPMLRVYNQDHESIYVTEEGIIVPSSPYYSPRLLIASGNFSFQTPTPKGLHVSDSICANTGLEEALYIAKAIRKDEFMTGNIGQIYKNTDNEYELMVNNVSARVILGDTVMVDDKLARLKILLERYSGTAELEAFKALNLKYKNQIVCTKK